MVLLLPGLLGASARNPSHAAEAAKAIGATELPGLRTLLSRARRQKHAGTGRSPESLLFESLGVETAGEHRPSAAVSALADGAGWQPESWIRADPVHLEAGYSDLRLGDPRELDMTRAESLALCSAINRTLDGVPGSIEPLAPDRWYMGLHCTPRISTCEPSIAVGGPIGGALPRGPDSVPWLRALTEIQMLLHDLPVNRTRAERGRPVINSVWFWGAGSLPPRPDIVPDVQVWSDSTLAHGLTLVLGVVCHPLPAAAGEMLPGGREGGLDVVYSEAFHYAGRLDEWSAWLDALRVWEAWCFEPLRKALWSGRLASLRIVSDGGVRHEVSASARWQWWRRAGALADLMPERGPSTGAEPGMTPTPGRPVPQGIREPGRDAKQEGPRGHP